MVGALKFLVFIVCIIAIPMLGRALFYNNRNLTFEEDMGLCLGAWVVAIILQWVIGKALDRPPQQYYGQQPTGPQYGQAQYGQPYQYQYQQQPPAQQYPQQRGYEHMGVMEPQVIGARTTVVKETSYRTDRNFLSQHICKQCGGPVDQKKRRCEYCGAWN